ncbi:MAG: YceI family protein [Bacteroidetes bacterium]|nr:YceI family protein [Bacteroidota bacterium]
MSKIKWSVDPEKSFISFRVDPLIFGPVEGSFRIFDADIQTTGDAFSTIDLILYIDAASISTGDIERDQHLKSADFFDVQNHKQIKFTSKRIRMESHDENHELCGELKIKDISIEVKVAVQAGEILEDASGNENSVFTINGKVNRTDWGLTWNASPQTGGLMESEEVTIYCKVTITRKHAASSSDLTVKPFTT